MIDIHTHILPAIDDGAADADEALKLLKAEIENGIDKVIFTPHFDCTVSSLDAFLQNRSEACERLLKRAEGEVIPQFKLGAEVKFSIEILDLDLSKLTLGESSYLLLELPYDRYPTFVDQVITSMRQRNITVILAHIERYTYFREHPNLLVELLERGALAQVTADKLINTKRRSFTSICIKNHLAQFIASDTHNIAKRPPCHAQLSSAVPQPLLDRCDAFAQSVWDDEDTPSVSPKKPYGFTLKSFKKFFR